MHVSYAHYAIGVAFVFTQTGSSSSSGGGGGVGSVTIRPFGYLSELDISRRATKIIALGPLWLRGKDGAVVRIAPGVCE